MKPYEKYKPSGVQWLGDIPKHWDVRRVKELGAIRYGLGQPPRQMEGGLPIIRATNVERGKINETNMLFVDPNDIPYDRDPVLRENDIIVVRSGAYTSDSAIIPQKYAGAITGYDMVFRPTKVNPKYMSYALLSEFLLRDQLILSSLRAAQPHLNKEELGTSITLFPSIEEQTAIAHYLDAKTATIDTKIALLTKKIDHCQALRKSLINETVCRGLDKNVEMKDSGIEWIGEVPRHWEVKRFKDINEIKRGASPRPIDDPIYFDDNGEFSWVRIADLTASERYLEVTKEKLSVLGASLSVKRYPNDFILSIAGTVGKPIITKIKCCIHDGFVWFPNLKLNPEFLYYMFTTGLPYQGLGKLGTQLNLNTETIGLISLPVPPKEEINEIVSYLDTQTQTLDNITTNLKHQIGTLKELRKTLINDVVTGKLCVMEAPSV